VFVDTGSLTPEQQIKSVLGPLTHTNANELSDVSALMFGPLLTDGSVVTIK
jgi:phospholipid/cholesterol/gamma-HCH transport system substrate-binding protein